MSKKLSTIALVVLVAIIAFACGNMVTEVEAQTSKRIYIGTAVMTSYQAGNPTVSTVYVVYEEDGVVKKEKVWQ
jgi:hypothetical protein